VNVLNLASVLASWWKNAMAVRIDEAIAETACCEREAMHRKFGRFRLN
jgi:hypothetical protein